MTHIFGYEAEVVLTMDDGVRIAVPGAIELDEGFRASPGLNLDRISAAIKAYVRPSTPPYIVR